MADNIIKNYVDTLVGFKPSAAFPLDIRTMFASVEAAEAAAASAVEIGSSDSIYYFGMELTVVENSTITKYTIQPNKTLRKSGSTLIGDSKSVEIKDTTVQLKGFGEKYYKYNAPDEILPDEYETTDQLPVSAKRVFAKVDGAWFVHTPGTGWDASEEEPVTTGFYSEEEGWIAGLEPRVTKDVAENEFYLAWYEPATTTVEGLSSVVDNLKTSTEANAKAISDLSSTVQDEITRAANAEEAIEGRLDILEGNSYVVSIAPSTNGSITVGTNDSEETTEVAVYELPKAGVGADGEIGGVKVDGTTIAISEDGTISVAKVDVTKVEGLETKFETVNNNIEETVTNQVTEVAVAKDNIATSENMTNNLEDASDEKVVSEKAFLSAMVWKETM